MNILGINTGHDSGATLITGDKVFAINEERLSRYKLHNGYPELAIDEVISLAEIDRGDIDLVVVEGQFITPQSDIGFDEQSGDWKKGILNRIGFDRFLLGTEMGLSMARLLLKPRTRAAHAAVRKRLANSGINPSPHFIDHHLCHAASAYYTQENEEALVLTLDASGEGYCSRVYSCSKGKMNLVHQIPCYHSPAYYYGYITKILGFQPMRHEGKITGLAAFGSAEDTFPILSQYIQFNKSSCRFENPGGYHIKVIEELTRDLKDHSKEDIACGIQKLAEELVCAYVDEAIRRFSGGSKTNICLAGGIFANVKINQRIDESELVKSTYIYPNMGDGGLNIGAALQGRAETLGLDTNQTMDHVFLGRSYQDAEIQSAMSSAGVEYVKSDNIEAEIAQLLQKKKIVCRFNGPMEFGPRALGNRSIIYEATDKELNIWLNKKLGRTEFMPFAPFVRDIDAADYFQIESASKRPFEFMTMTCNVTDRCVKEAPAVVHIDRTARPQIVNEDKHLSFYKILSEYKSLTGLGILVNTSFNLHEEPIVNTPAEAIQTFQKSGLDALAIHNYLIQN